MISAKFILLPFALLHWLEAWCIRFLPGRDRTGVLLKRVVALALGAMALVTLIVELLMYVSLTKQPNLKHDIFFFVAMSVQGLVGLGIVFASESALRRKERQFREDSKVYEREPDRSH